MKIFVTIISFLSLVDLLAASELPAPFTQLETTSTEGCNGTWVSDETGISGDIYAGRTLLRKYTVYGKASLEPGEEWHSPTNALDRFFTVGVEMK